MFIHHLGMIDAGERPGKILQEWAAHHKTMIVLNGGTSEDLLYVFRFLLDRPELRLPFEKFNEPGIDNALTCIGVVLDENMMECMGAYKREETYACDTFVDANGETLTVPPIIAEVRGDLTPKWTEDQWNLVKMLASKPLA
jgi:hypothetical protein